MDSGMSESLRQHPPVGPTSLFSSSLTGCHNARFCSTGTNWRLTVSTGFSNGGRWFSDARYAHAYTVTGPGHATMLTGSTPSLAASSEANGSTYIGHRTNPLDGTSPKNLQVESPVWDRRVAACPADGLTARVPNCSAAGDVRFALKANWSFALRATGTTHESPYDYDTHVPLLFYGPKWIGKGRVDKRVEVVDIAPTLAALLGIAPPAAAEGIALPLVKNQSR